MSDTIILQIDNPIAFCALKCDSELYKQINEAKRIEVYIENALINHINFDTKKEIINSTLEDELIGKVFYKKGLIENFDSKSKCFIENIFLNKFNFASNIKYFCLKTTTYYLNNNLFKYKTLKIFAKERIYFCKQIKSYLKEHRYNHSVSVADTAYEIAKQNGFDESFCLKCYIAGLFHDVSKDLSTSLQYEYGKIYSPFKIDKIEDFAYHQLASCLLSKEEFGLSDDEILKAISNHCTGNGYMDSMSMILYSADKVEPLREFKTENLRQSCLNNFEVGFKEVLQDQVNYFIKNNIPYKGNIFTAEMYKIYLNN